MAVADAWARSRLALRESRQRMAVDDSLIAATAMALDVPAMTKDDHFPSLPDLEVIRV